MRLTRGGPTIGDIATHYLPPGTGGFEEAGGMNGTGVDFLSVDGKPNPELSAEYFKKAGYASGKYEGTEKILMVGSNVGVAAKTAEVVKENLEKMGFQIQMRLVQPQTMYTRYCNTPSAKVAICPNVGWIRDFADGQPVLSPTFAGKNILDAGQLELAAARRRGDQRRDRRGRDRSGRPAPGGLGRDRQADRRDRSRHPVAVGQDPADHVQERQRRRG